MAINVAKAAAPSNHLYFARQVLKGTLEVITNATIASNMAIICLVT